MGWLENELDLEPGADGVVRWETSTQAISDYAEALGSGDMKGLIDDFFGTQKRFAEYLGVGESTVAGWLKANSFPDYAMRASIAAYVANRKSAELASEVAQFASPTVVKDGSAFNLVSYERDTAGTPVGRVIAKEIPSEKIAHFLASASVAWQLVGELCEGTEYLWKDDYDTSGAFVWLRELHERATNARFSALDHDRYLEWLKEQVDRRVEEKRRLEALTLEIDLNPSPSNDPTKGERGDE